MLLEAPSPVFNIAVIETTSPGLTEKCTQLESESLEGATPSTNKSVTLGVFLKASSSSFKTTLSSFPVTHEEMLAVTNKLNNIQTIFFIFFYFNY